MKKFQAHNGFTKAFTENKLTFGLFLPLVSFARNTPITDVGEHIRLIQNFVMLESSNCALYGKYYHHITPFISYEKSKQRDRLAEEIIDQIGEYILPHVQIIP